MTLVCSPVKALNISPALVYSLPVVGSSALTLKPKNSPPSGNKVPLAPLLNSIDFTGSKSLPSKALVTPKSAPVGILMGNMLGFKVFNICNKPFSMDIALLSASL